MMRVMSAQQAAAAPQASAPGMVAPAAPPAEPYVLLGGDGSPVLKLKQSDVARIKEDAGESPEDLEDSDLQESMRDLGIQSLPLTDADRKTLGMAPVGAPSAPAAAAASAVAVPPAPPAPSPSIEGQLQQYASLRDKGLISPEDYEAKKKQILGL